MNERMYESIYDKLVRHGYIYIEKKQVPAVLNMVSTDERFGNYAKEKGVTVNEEDNTFLVKLTINDWKPYSSNV